MDELHWARWLCRITSQTSMRGVALRVGVSHTTVQRWTRDGVPPDRITELTVRFNADPIESLVLAGHLREEDIPHLNYAALVKYAPLHVLEDEIHSRISTYARTREDPLRKTGTGIRHPKPSDITAQSSFQLSSKN